MNIFEDLESNNAQKVEEFKMKLRDQFNATKEPWLLNGVYDYFLKKNSSRAVEVLVMVKEPHDKHYFDRALDGMKGKNKLQHLTLLGHVVRKKPIWLYQIFHHPIIRELLRILKSETDIVVVVSGLVILNILIPSIPGMVGPFLKDIFDVFSKLAAMNANSNNDKDAQLVHLQLSLYTLFHRLYGMFPNSFLSFLRKQYANTEDMIPVFSHTVKPMLNTVRVNPLLIIADEEWEKQPMRWKNVESHDIVVDCAKLLMKGREYPQNNIDEAKSKFNCETLLEALKVTINQTVSDYCKQSSKSAADVTLWSPSVRFYKKKHIESTPTMIPVTPARAYEVSSPYSEHEGSSPPEAAVEATPETTPIQECIQAPLPLLITANRPLAFGKESAVHGTKVPMSDRSFPSSPIKKEPPPFRYSAPEIVPPCLKINSLLTDRNQVPNDRSIIEVKPIGIQMRNDLVSNERTHSVISTINASSFVEGTREETNGSRPTDVTIAEAVDDFDPCEQEKRGFPPPQPAKFTDQVSSTKSENSLEERCLSVYEIADTPSKLLQKYIDAAIQCHNDKRESSSKSTTISLAAENKYLTNQLRLLGAQLQLEEYKREIHAERNRRLLGRSRRNKTLEEYNNALKKQVSLLQKEIEQSNEEVTKIVIEKEAQIEREQKAATYWREQFISLQQEHKLVANRCQKVEAQLKEEKDSNEQNQKWLHEKRAELNDITNDLRSFQKEALEAKHLRNTVAELQAEILKAGELIISYRNQLVEPCLPNDDRAQREFIQQAYLKEVESLKQIINNQQLSLDASKELVAKLKRDLEDKENNINNFSEKLRKAREIQQKEIKELKKKLEETEALYEKEAKCSKDLNAKLNRAIHVTRFSNVPIPPRNIGYSTKLSAALDMNEGTGSRSAQDVPKSPKRSYFVHSDKQQIELSKRVCPEDSSHEKEHKANATIESSQTGVVKCDKIKAPEPIEVLREADTAETTEVFRSIVKKKGRMECAESGQLRSISISYFDPEPSSSKTE